LGVNQLKIGGGPGGGGGILLLFISIFGAIGIFIGGAGGIFIDGALGIFIFGASGIPCILLIGGGAGIPLFETFKAGFKLFPPPNDTYLTKSFKTLE